MANASGVPIENIVKMSGISRASITKTRGRSTSTITGWVLPSGPTCQTTQTFYMNLAQGDYYNSRRSLSYFCRNALTTTIEVGNDGIFYANGQCGVTQATSGYYFTGTGGGSIYRWVNGADGTDQSPSGYTIEGQCA